MEHACSRLDIDNKEGEMENRIVITVNDYQRLMELMKFASLRMPRVASRMSENLSAARMLKQEDIGDNIITMNSRVKLKNLTSNREIEVTITYPQEANPRERRVSVFSDIGIALLGKKEKEIVSWQVPGGIGSFEIAKVTYQPEAAGDFLL
jgi:regulator of nucleoside diphosphate kinase